MEHNNGLSVLCTAKMCIFLYSQIHSSIPGLCKREHWLTWAEVASVLTWAHQPSLLTWADGGSVLTWAHHLSPLTWADGASMLTWAHHPSLLTWADHPSLFMWADPASLPTWADRASMPTWADGASLFIWADLTSLPPPFPLLPWASVVELWWHQRRTKAPFSFLTRCYDENGTHVNSSQPLKP